MLKVLHTKYLSWSGTQIRIETEEKEDDLWNVIAALVISISSNTSEESVGSHALRVILFGSILAIIPVIPKVPVVPADPIVTPEVGTVSVVSPTQDRHSSADSSSSSAPSNHSLSGHTPPDTTDADSSTPQRFVHRLLAKSSLGSSSERSLDSSSPSFRPSRKRCRSPTASVQSPTHVSRSIAPTPVDPLPPRKRFRDSYSLEDSGEEHMEVDTADAEAVADRQGYATNTREIAVDPLAISDSSKSSKGGNGYSLKDKNKAKTGHENGKSVKSQSQRRVHLK
ncbi:hypothetical protein Tco_0753208 [Tanacetum coccineum]